MALLVNELAKQEQAQRLSRKKEVPSRAFGVTQNIIDSITRPTTNNSIPTMKITILQKTWSTTAKTIQKETWIRYARAWSSRKLNDVVTRLWKKFANEFLQTKRVLPS